MPYIKKKEKKHIECSDCDHVETPGQLNFVLTRVVSTYLNDKKLSYQTINDILGALEGAKLEFYRRVAVPYENQKLSENGDVY